MEKLCKKRRIWKKAKKILCDSTYTSIKCTIDWEDIRGEGRRIEALESIDSTQQDVLKKFNLALAVKLNGDKICYAIVDENGSEISKVDMYDTATFFMNNFEKI